MSQIPVVWIIVAIPIFVKRTIYFHAKIAVAFVFFDVFVPFLWTLYWNFHRYYFFLLPLSIMSVKNGLYQRYSFHFGDFVTRVRPKIANHKIEWVCTRHSNGTFVSQHVKIFPLPSSCNGYLWALFLFWEI